MASIRSLIWPSPALEVTFQSRLESVCMNAQTAYHGGPLVNAAAAKSSRRLEQVPEPEPSSRNSERFLKVAPLFQSNNPRSRVSAQSPAVYAVDYSGQ